MYSKSQLNDIHNILPKDQKNAVKIIKKHIDELRQRIEHGIEAQLLIHEINNAMVQLFDFALKNHLLTKLFRYFMKDIKSWLITITQTSNNVSTAKTFLLPFLSECACIGNGVFNRFKNDMREKIECSVLNFLQNRIAETTSKEINYLSLGSGELLQDFIIINKILLILSESERKITEVTVTLIDPIYEDMTENLLNTGDQFEYLVELAGELGILLNMQIYSSIDEYQANDPKKQDVIMATDFESFHTTAFKSAIKAHKMLETNGRMFLSVWKERYILGKTQSLSSLPAISYLHEFPLKNKNHVKIASLVERNIFIIYPMILPYIQQLKNCKIVTLTLPHPQKIDKEGFWLGAKYPDLNISKADLHYFISLFLPQDTRLILDFVTGNKNFDKLLPQFSEDQDLIFCYDKQYKEQKETLFMDIAAVHKKFPSAGFLFRMQTIKNPPSESENIFNCQWIYNQEEHSTTIISGDDESAAILSEAYRYVVSENKIQDV